MIADHDSILIDAMGSGVLLPTALIPPPQRNGAPLVDRAIAAGLTAMNVTMGISGIGMGIDNFRSMIGTIHGYLSYFELDDRLVHVLSVADIRRAKHEGKVKLRLDAPVWLAVQQQLYRGCGPFLGGPLKTAALATALALLILQRHDRKARRALVIAVAAYAGMIAVFFIFNSRVNAAVSAWTPATLPPDWPS